MFRVSTGVEPTFATRPRGPMDKALVFGTKDCRFESYRGHELAVLFRHFL